MLVKIHGKTIEAPDEGGLLDQGKFTPINMEDFASFHDRLSKKEAISQLEKLQELCKQQLLSDSETIPGPLSSTFLKHTIKTGRLVDEQINIVKQMKEFAARALRALATPK